MIMVDREDDGTVLRFVPGNPYRGDLCRSSPSQVII